MKKQDTPLAPTALDEILDRDAAERRHRAVAERAEKDAALRQAIEARNELVTEDDKARLGIDKDAAEALLGAVERDALPSPTPAAARRPAKTTQPRVLPPQLGHATPLVETAPSKPAMTWVLLVIGGAAALACVVAIVIWLRGEDGPPPSPSVAATSPESRVEPPSTAAVPVPGSSVPEPQASAAPSSPPSASSPRPVPPPSAQPGPASASSTPAGDPLFDPNNWKFKKPQR